MNKAECVAAVAEKTTMSKADVNVSCSALFETTIDVLVKPDKIAIQGLGTFATPVRKERKGRNPLTSKEMTIPKTVVAHLKAATLLKETINHR